MGESDVKQRFLSFGLMLNVERERERASNLGCVHIVNTERERERERESSSNLGRVHIVNTKRERDRASNLGCVHIVNTQRERALPIWGVFTL